MTEVIQSPDLQEMTIGDLRKFASHMRLALAKTDTKEEIIKAIDRKLQGRSAPTFALPESEVKPGYAKIRVLSDPMPGASNLPIFVNANGYQATLPRDVDIIVPDRVVRVLQDATVMRKKQSMTSDNHGREIFRETDVRTPSYPFQILERVPGPEVLTTLEKSKQRIEGPRKRYRDLFGHWPRPGELTRAIEQRLIKLDDDESLTPSEEKLMGQSNSPIN